MSFDVARIRRDFPILSQTVHGKPLVYLDNGATTQKPQAVIDATSAFYAHDNANVHRGVYALSERATAAYEGARETVRRFLNAHSTQEVIFTRGTTESINLVAHSLGQGWQAGDEVIITAMEHHSNIVPWQLLRDRLGIVLKVIPMDQQGELQVDALAPLLTAKTRLLSIVQVSNALGTINPVQALIQQAHQAGVPVLVDAAQSVAHGVIDVQALDCDFLAFSSHKIYGPTGVGVLYGKKALLNKMPPYQGGGDMIRTVSFEKTTYAELPMKFEAGTPNIAGVVGLGAALNYVDRIGRTEIAAYEQGLLRYATEALQSIPGLKIIGTAKAKASVIAFSLGDIHPHDIASIVDQEGVAIRAGHHCAMPVMDFFKVPATARMSLAMYNTQAEVDALVQALHGVQKLLG